MVDYLVYCSVMSEYKISSVTNRILAMKFASEFIMIYPLMTIMFAERGQVGAAESNWNLILGELSRWK